MDLIKNVFLLAVAVVFTFILSLSNGNVFASTELNNKFGIHITQPSDKELKQAAELVNSNGGDWGYITLVIQENDRDTQKWNTVFNKLRHLHLIPIIRLATSAKGNYWRRPDINDTTKWVHFLNSLTWVVKKRYVILFNEPNHGKEWGGKVDVRQYANISLAFAKKLKESNPDYFVMLAGLDASAPHNPPLYEDEKVFLEQLSHHKDLFKYVDGLASHSYPPSYIGSPHISGRRSIKTYEWELQILKKMGVKKQLPVFITETGWINSMRNVDKYFEYAFKKVWLQDERVIAVTPFILEYQTYPFSQFSWIKPNDKGVYPQYTTIQNIHKTKGKPEIIDKGIISFNFPKTLAVLSKYHFQLTVKNTGQALWDKTYHLAVEPQSGVVSYFFSNITETYPGQNTTVDFYFKTGDKIKIENERLLLIKDNKDISSIKWVFKTAPLPSLDIYVSLYPKFRTTSNNFEIQLFNSNEEMVFKKKNISIKNGQGKLPNIQNIVFGKKYRVVILKDYYLPRQTFVIFHNNNESIRLSKMFPLDLNKDGKFSMKDLVSLIKRPRLLSLFIP